MTAPVRAVASVLALASAGLIAACGSAAPSTGGSPAAWAPPAGAQLLDTSTDTAAGTWATLVMGGPVAAHNNFWELFIRPPGGQSWKLVTPPGVADNGGLVLAAGGNGSLITGFRPSQGLTYSPLTKTLDSGRAWSSTGPLDNALANVPDALAAAPAGGNLLALTVGGAALLAGPAYTHWNALTSLRSLAATPAGRRCGLRGLTAATYAPAGQPLLAGSCSRPGTAGIFSDATGTWQAAGPAIPAALARQPVTVVRLTQIAGQNVALLVAGTGRSAVLLAAWSADNGRHWTLSDALRLHGAVASASFGAARTAAVITSSGRSVVTTSTGSWRTLPALPAGTATLALNPGGQADALAVHHGTLTVWQLSPGGTSWIKAQTIHVPIQYGSSS